MQHAHSWSNVHRCSYRMVIKNLKYFTNIKSYSSKVFLKLDNIMWKSVWRKTSSLIVWTKGCAWWPSWAFLAARTCPWPPSCLRCFFKAMNSGRAGVACLTSGEISQGTWSLASPSSFSCHRAPCLFFWNEPFSSRSPELVSSARASAR